MNCRRRSRPTTSRAIDSTGCAEDAPGATSARPLSSCANRRETTTARVPISTAASATARAGSRNSGWATTTRATPRCRSTAACIERSRDVVQPFHGPEPPDGVASPVGAGALGPRRIMIASRPCSLGAKLLDPRRHDVDRRIGAVAPSAAPQRTPRAERQRELRESGGRRAVTVAKPRNRRPMRRVAFIRSASASRPRSSNAGRRSASGSTSRTRETRFATTGSCSPTARVDASSCSSTIAPPIHSRRESPSIQVCDSIEWKAHAWTIPNCEAPNPHGLSRQEKGRGLGGRQERRVSAPDPALSWDDHGNHPSRRSHVRLKQAIRHASPIGRGESRGRLRRSPGSGGVSWSCLRRRDRERL